MILMKIIGIPLSTPDTSMVAQPLPGFIQNVKNNSIYTVKWCCSAKTYISLLSLCDHLFPIDFLVAAYCLFRYKKNIVTSTALSLWRPVNEFNTYDTTSSYKQLAKVSAGSSALIPPFTLYATLWTIKNSRSSEECHCTSCAGDSLVNHQSTAYLCSNSDVTFECQVTSKPEPTTPKLPTTDVTIKQLLAITTNQKDDVSGTLSFGDKEPNQVMVTTSHVKENCILEESTGTVTLHIMGPSHKSSENCQVVYVYQFKCEILPRFNLLKFKSTNYCYWNHSIIRNN